MKTQEMNSLRIMKRMKQWDLSIPKLLIAVAIPLVTGIISSVLTSDAMRIYGEFHKPAAAPPSWLFPIAWTVLYIMMGTASYLVFSSKADPIIKRTGLSLYFAQLVLNFVWSMLFFSAQMYLLAFFELIAMWLLVIVCTIFFFKSSRAAGYMMLPYIAWTTFAAYLNLSVYLLSVKPMPLMILI